MYVAVLQISFELPFVEGLKGRRKILNSLKERLKNKNCSVVDLSSEYPKEAKLGVVFATLSEDGAKQKIYAIEELIASLYPELFFEIESEIL